MIKSSSQSLNFKLFKVIGLFQQKLFICFNQGDSAIYLLDQHALHQRVRYEYYLLSAQNRELSRYWHPLGIKRYGEQLIPIYRLQKLKKLIPLAKQGHSLLFPSNQIISHKNFMNDHLNLFIPNQSVLGKKYIDNQDLIQLPKIINFRFIRFESDCLNPKPTYFITHFAQIMGHLPKKYKIIEIAKQAFSYFENKFNELRRIHIQPKQNQNDISKYKLMSKQLISDKQLFLNQINSGDFSKDTFVPNSIVEIIATHSCKGAYKFNSQVTQQVFETILGNASLCQNPQKCIHGRPTYYPVAKIVQDCNNNN